MKEDRISALPEEILLKIVYHIQPDYDRVVPFYHRGFLSAESLDNTSPTDADRDAKKHILQFRRTCRRFAEVGEQALFSVVHIRLSIKDLEELRKFAGFKRNVARHVKRFSYLVPCFYILAERFLTPPRHSGLSPQTLRKFQERLAEQKRIRDSHEDVPILADALRRFTSLQVVKLLRVSDDWDLEIRDYIKEQEGLEHWAERYWAPSCEYGSFAIGKALLSANVDLSRYYVPAMHVGTLSKINPTPPASLSKLAASLTCLTLVFDDGHELDERIDKLSPLFKKVFYAAENMQAIHIGFPKDRPFNHPLEAVFHHRTWNKLLAFGIAGWSLHADEIIGLATRHKAKLKGLRLRDVLMKEPDRWKDVLSVLKVEMEHLEWLSLRRIGYAETDEFMNGGGAEVPDDTNLSSSTEDSDYDEPPEAGPSDQYTNGHYDAEDESEANHSFDDDEDGPGDNETDFPPTVLVEAEHTTNHMHSEIERIDLDDVVDLDDNGRFISRQKSKTWEEWVVKHRRRR